MPSLFSDTWKTQSSPSINRFLQPDSIIPDLSNPQIWNRYSYVYNNPVLLNDPTGHCPLCIGVLAVLAVAAVTEMALEATGVIPEYAGVSTAEKVVTDKNAIVGGGIAVQSNWYSKFWDNPGNPHASSYGLAQAKSEELKGRNPMDPSVAVAVMTERINDAVSHCNRKKLCQDETDNFIVAALAQNGNSPNGWLDIPSLPKSSDGSADWVTVMNQGGRTGNPLAKTRQVLTGKNYNTQFMLTLYTRDVKSLIRRGFELPEDYDGVDWKNIDNLLKVK